MKKIVLCLFLTAVFSESLAQQGLKEKLLTLKSESQLELTDTVSLKFATFHTQGLTKVGETFFLSAVDVKRWPRKYKTPVGKIDRDTGEGTGRIYKFDIHGNLLQEITIGTDSIYHPGGIDFDGKYIWIPVCEYRPFGKSIMYRMDPETMQTEKMWEYEDALGAVITTGQDEIIAMNWDAALFYRWTKKNKVWKLQSVEENNTYTFKFQDGQAVGKAFMLCSGLNRWSNGLTLGGIQLINSKDYSTVYQLPVSLKAKKGGSLNGNPFYAEVLNDKLRLYFAPEDDHTILYIYEMKQ